MLSQDFTLNHFNKLNLWIWYSLALQAGASNAGVFLACGSQNAAATSASGAVISTTHLTGIITDLSIGVVRVLSAHLTTDQRKLETRKFGIRSSLILSLAAGSSMGAYFFLQFQDLGYLFPATISIVMTLLALQYRKSLHPTRPATI
jgi:uncharacterized membrane protein YoaK (UPF0700 family)